MGKILFGIAAAVAGYTLRKRGVRVAMPGQNLNTLGIFLGRRLYVDFYYPLGMFWCRKDDEGRIIKRGWVNFRAGVWKIETAKGVVRGGWVPNVRRSLA